MNQPFIEILEPRIAPAAIFTYTDVDGDLVTIKTSKGTNEQLAGILTSTNSGLGSQLTGIDFSADAAHFNGTNLTVSAKPQNVTGRGHDGDGFANVGYIDATAADGDGQAVDLGAIRIAGDLGAIQAGGGVPTAPAVKSLSVHSLGVLGTSTGSPTLQSVFTGSVVALTVAGDVKEAHVTVGGNLTSLKIGGSLIGGSADNSGRIDLGGKTATVKINGSLLGGAGQNAAVLFSTGGITQLNISGSVVGGVGGGSGQIDVFGATGSINIEGDLRGGISSGNIFATHDLKSVRIGGSVFGRSTGTSGVIHGDGAIGKVTILGDLVGGTRGGTGGIEAMSVSSIVIGGSLIGGTSSGAATQLGYISSNAIKSIVIGHDIRGGDVTTAVTLSDTGAIASRHIGSLVVGGSIVAGHESNGGTLVRSGSIVATDDLGPITVKGSIIGNDTNFVSIFARGQAFPTATTDVAIKSLMVGGKVELAWIFGGVDFQGVGTNGNAQIGAVKVGGDWIASTLESGCTSTDGTFGDANDAVIPGGTISRIASIVIGGQVLGEVGTNNTFGFLSHQIGSFKTGGVAIPIKPGAGNDTFALGNERSVGASLSSINPEDGFAVHVFEV